MTSTQSAAGPAGLSPPYPFEDFYRQTVGVTFSCIRALAGDEDLAKDATQEAYVRMWQRWDQRCTRCLVDNQRYVIKIARNWTIDRYRERARFSAFTADLEFPTEDPDLLAVSDDPSVLKAVRRYLDTLSERPRMVALLRFFDGRDSAEIAMLLGIEEKTVQNYLAQVRKALRGYRDQMTDPDEGGAP